MLKEPSCITNAAFMTKGSLKVGCRSCVKRRQATRENIGMLGVGLATAHSARMLAKKSTMNEAEIDISKS